MFEAVQVQKSSENEPKNGGADFSPIGDFPAPVPSIAPCKRLINYPAPDKLREYSQALGAYLVRRISQPITQTNKD